MLAGGLAAQAQQADPPTDQGKKRTLFYGRAPLPPASSASVPVAPDSLPKLSSPQPATSTPAVSVPPPQATSAHIESWPLPPAAKLPATNPLPAGIQTAGLQQPGNPMNPVISLDSSESLSVDLPGPETLFSLVSDAALREQMRQETRSKQPQSRLEFPVEPVLTTSNEPYSRHWEKPMHDVVEPNYVCYGRLLFEQKNVERNVWDLGPIGPLACVSKFYWDVFWLPYHAGTEPCRHYECSAGYCLPGDPTPFYLYPPRFSATGLAAQAAALTGVFLAFP